MAIAKRRDAWDRTANVLAILININRDPKKSEAVTADDCHPLRRELEPLTPEQQAAMLKEQCATIRERDFEGKVTIIPPFVPINAEE